MTECDRVVNGRAETFNMRNMYIGFAHLVNQLSGNYMILQKFLTMNLICMMMDVELINLHSYLKDHHLDLANGLFILDNDNKPRSFKVVFKRDRERPLRVFAAEDQ